MEAVVTGADIKGLNNEGLNNNGLNNNGLDNNGLDNSAVKGETPAFNEADAKTSRAVFIYSLASAFLYSLCFSGAAGAGASTVLFFVFAVSGLYFMLKYVDKIKNKKAFLLAVPIVILSVFNLYYEYSQYNTYNCLAFFVLYTIMCLKAVNDEKISLGSIISTVFNNCFSGTAKTVSVVKSINKGKFYKVILGLLCSIPVLGVICALLMSGDDKFSAVVSKILRACLLDGSMAWSCIVFAFAFVYICGLVYSVLNKKARKVNSFGADTVISVSFLTPVNLLFLFFFISQLGYVEEGTFVYSEYAREGFFQLLLVTFINFGIIFAFTGIFKTNSRVVKYMLTALCVFTFMLILSSYYRMFLYIGVYGFTQMRVEVLGFLTAETVLVFITVYHILRDKQGLLKYFALCGFICLFVLNIVARPEVSADINYRILEDKSNVLEDAYYSEVILTDRLYKDGKISKYKAKSLIEDMDRYGNNGKSENWQSFSIQHYMCDKVLEKWGVKNEREF